MATNLRGIDAFLRVLADSGVTRLFGNPGSTELPLMDALLGQDRIEYVLGLHEIPVMAMADGYAQASRSVGVVNLHVSCGLGNAMGMLYNAYRAGTPMLVTAGQQDQRLAFEEPILWGNMVDTARPWTKWSEEVRRPEDVPTAVRRALQLAMAPPTGPVFLSLPLDVQMDAAPMDLAPAAVLDHHVRPPEGAIAQAAEVLATAENPAILVGSRVAEAEAVEELVAVAERLGAPVRHESPGSHGRCSFPSSHPLAGQPLPFWSPEVREELEQFDVLLIVGMKVLQQYIYHEPARAIPESIRLVQIDEDPWEVGKNYPVEVGVMGHPKPALAALDSDLAERTSEADQAQAAKRFQRWARTHQESRAALRAEAVGQFDERPATRLAVLEQTARLLPDDVVVLEESPTTTKCYFERAGVLPTASGYFAHRGWALGWGLNCAIGVKMAWPDRPVLAIIGDGSALYGFQGLWTAAQRQLPVTFLVTNNRQYKILKDCSEVLKLETALAGQFLGMDLDRPAVDYVALAESFGVPGCRIDDPAAAAEAVAESFTGDGPRLIEVPIEAGSKN